jgi:dihydroxy-acid dehydratase
MTDAEAVEFIASASPSPGHCNTMGTALTMNSLAEAIGMSLPGCAAIPAAHRERGEIGYRTGRRIVEMVREDVKPSDIMTREAFENAIALVTALGGSTNAPIHLAAIARHLGIELDLTEWQRIGRDLPLLVDLQPAGKYLAEDFFQAGGVPAVMGELLRRGRIHEDQMTVNGHTVGANYGGAQSQWDDVIRPWDEPVKAKAGFLVLTGNLFDNAIMKTSVISDEFRRQYLADPDHPNSFVSTAIVFEGPEDYHARIDDPELHVDVNTILVIRGTGAVGYPGSAEVVNMQPPAAAIASGLRELPCLGDGRQSGTSGSPSILNASPEAAAGGGLALLATGDRIRVDLDNGRVDVLVPADEWAERLTRLEEGGGFSFPESQTPWQEIQRGIVGQLGEGMTLTTAEKYHGLAQKWDAPRHSH